MKHYIWIGVTLLAILCSIALMAQTVINGYRIYSDVAKEPGAPATKNQTAIYTYAGALKTIANGGSAAALVYSPVAVADVAAILKARSLTMVITGSGTAGVLQDTDDQPAVWYNSLGQGVTITGVSCKTDSATATRIQLNRDDGSPAAILTDNTGAGVDCSSTRAAGALDGTEEHIASTNGIDFVVVTAGGAGKWVSVTVTYTLD